MALRAFIALALLAAADVHSARVKPQVQAKAGPPSIEDLTPGTAVTFTDRRERLAGTVDSIDTVTMVTIKTRKFGRDKMVKKPLESVRLSESEKDDKPKAEKPASRPSSPDRSQPEEDDSDDEDSNEDGGCGKPMSTIQKITCDVCLRKLTSCGGYKPTTSMLSPVFGKPESPNNRYYNCPASERAAWSTEKDIKVWEDGFSVDGELIQSTKNMTAEGDRSLCKTERRASPVDGKLKHARRICKRGLRSKYSGKGSFSHLSYCTNLVRNKASVFSRDKDHLPVCTKTCLYTYPK